jgi:hypothetical protein
MKVLTRDRDVPIMSASVAWLTFAITSLRRPASAVASPSDRRDLRRRNDRDVLQRIQWSEQWRLQQRASHRRQQRAAGVHPAMRELPDPCPKCGKSKLQR